MKFYWTAAPMTVEGPRKGEPSTRIVRNGLRTQPAYSVRGSSRRIMSMRFRPAHISVINRRDSYWAVIGPAVPNPLKAHQREPVPATPPVDSVPGARTVLAVKGSLRRAKHRRALDGSAPFRPSGGRDERLRREQETVLWARKTRKPKPQPSKGLDRSLHINSPTVSLRDRRQVPRPDPCRALAQDRPARATR